MQLEQEPPTLSPADVLQLRRCRCSRAEISAYTGLDVVTVRGMEREAIASIPVENLGINVEQMQ